MTNRKRLAAIALALMGFGFVGQGVALAQRPPQPVTPPGRDSGHGNPTKPPEQAADPYTGDINRGIHH